MTMLTRLSRARVSLSLSLSIFLSIYILRLPTTTHAQGLSCGSNDYICKPFRKLELLARIDTQLRLRRAWQVEIEREKSEVLLRRMLPHHIIQRLSEPGHNGVIADQHAHVAVLFTDIVGFTAMSARLPTIEIIEMLNEASAWCTYDQC